MLLILALACVAFTASILAGPKLVRVLSDWQDRHEWMRLERQVLNGGTKEQREKLDELKRRDVDLRLKLLEMRQAQDVLSSPIIRQQLENADIDVERLKQLLDPAAFENDLDRRIGLLDEMKDSKLLTLGEKK